MMETIQKAFEMAGGSEGLSALFLTGLIALWYSKFNKGTESGYLFWYALAILLVVINPLYYFGVNQYLPELQEHNMMLWLLPTTPVIMYVCVSATSLVKKRIDKVVFGFAMVIILILAGTTSYTGNGHAFIANASYIPQSEYEMITIIEEYRKENQMPNVMLWGDQEIMQYARTYSGNINLLYGKDLWLGSQDTQLHQIYDEETINAYREMEHAPFFLPEIGSTALERGCDILVLTQNDFALSGIEIPKQISDVFVLYSSSSKYLMYVRND